MSQDFRIVGTALRNGSRESVKSALRYAAQGQIYHFYCDDEVSARVLQWSMIRLRKTLGLQSVVRIAKEDSKIQLSPVAKAQITELS